MTRNEMEQRAAELRHLIYHQVQDRQKEEERLNQHYREVEFLEAKVKTHSKEVKSLSAKLAELTLVLGVLAEEERIYADVARKWLDDHSVIP